MSLLKGDRLCGGSVDILGDRFLMRLGAIAVWCCWFVDGRSPVRESVDILGNRFVTEIRGDRRLMLLVVWAIASTKKWYDKLYEFGFINENS